MHISVQSMQQCIFIFTHRGGNVSALKFYSTLRPLIAWEQMFYPGVDTP